MLYICVLPLYYENMKPLTLLLLAFLLVSCGPGRLATPSGNPELTIPDVTIEGIKEIIIHAMMNDGYTVDYSGPYGMNFKRSVQRGTIYTHVVTEKAAFSFVQSGTGVRIMLTHSTIYPVSGVSELQNSQKELVEQQRWLNALAGLLKSSKPASKKPVIKS
jgi:hypothetical protein